MVCLAHNLNSTLASIITQALIDHMHAARNSPSHLALVATAGGAAVEGVLRGKRVERGLLVVGPEGDFTGEELQGLLDAGALPVGLGPLRLRVETAALALLSVASNCELH